MKHTLSVALLVCAVHAGNAQNVGINDAGTAPFSGAILDVQSTTRGMLLPRMTTAQRLALTNLTAGLNVYDTNLNMFMYYTNAWKELGGNGWSLAGNASVGAGQFIGTTDASVVQFRTQNLERIRLDAQGNLVFTSDQQTLRFASSTGNSNQPMMMMFTSGTQNRDRMVIAHSPSNPLWGMEYRDTNDVVFLRRNTKRQFAFNLASGRLGIGTETPEYPLDAVGRLRLQSNGNLDNSPGIWFSNQTNTFDRAFLGMEQSDSTLGIFSQHLGRWTVQYELMREPRLGVGMRNTIDGGTVRAEIHILHTNFGGSNDGLRIQNEGANANYWNLYTSNSTGALEFYNEGFKRGSIDPASGAYTAASDRRVKRNMAAIPTGTLRQVMQLQPMRYQFASFSDDEGHTISSDRYHFGFMAQDVKQIFPELVFEGADNPAQNFMTMNYAGFGVLAIKAIQEQQQEIQTLRSEVAELKQLVQKLLNQ